MKSVFFWSEEHARAHRRTKGWVRGIYLTLEQMVLQTRLIQSAIFGFERMEHNIRS
jgi:hypothetical protein